MSFPVSVIAAAYVLYKRVDLFAIQVPETVHDHDRAPAHRSNGVQDRFDFHFADARHGHQIRGGLVSEFGRIFNHSTASETWCA